MSVITSILVIPILSCTLNLQFKPADLQIVNQSDRAVFVLQNGEFIGNPGTPMLPVVGINLPLPSGTGIDRFQVIEAEFETLAGTFHPATVQPPTPLCLPPPLSLDLSPEITCLSGFYPESIFSVAGYGYWHDQKFASLLITPLQYHPETNRIRLLSRLRCIFELKKIFEPTPPAATGNGFEYLIITRAELDSIFSELAWWRTITGTRAQIRYIEWIAGNYPGRDDAEKLRNYLKYCARDSGLKYLLLGGDTDILPHRRAHALISGAGLHPREDSLPCDLYFSALDGNWDSNNNGTYGEPDDEVDLYPEIFVGRAPVSNPVAARIFVNKVLAYERGLLGDYQNRAILAASVLWENPWTDEMVAKERLRTRYLPAHLQIHPLYESQMPVNTDTALSLLNAGFGFFNHCGHGWINALALGRECVLRNSDIDGLTNNLRWGICYSIGCWTAAFDYDCIAEHFLLNPAGGAVAFIGNSSYGWGAPGNPGFGYSDRFDQRFFQELFTNPEMRLGEIFARTKIHFIPYSYQPNVYRWHQFALNLLGDPAMRVHTDTLSQLSVRKPLRIRTGSDIARFIVFDTNRLLPNATVALHQDQSNFYTATTQADGTAVIETRYTQPGSARVTITAPNHRPLGDSIIISSGHNLILTGYSFIDSAGDADGCISAGETFALQLMLKNSASVPVSNVHCRLEVDSPLINVEQDVGIISTLPPDTVVSVRLFLLRSAPNARDRDYALGTLTITEPDGSFTRFPVIIQFRQPVLKVIGYYTDLEKETLYSVFIRATNAGMAPASTPTGTLFNPDLNPGLKLVTPGIILPSIQPGETVWSAVPGRFTSASSPIRIGLNLISGRFIFSDTIKIHLSQAGISTNFDSGIGNWQTRGSNGSWYLTDRYFLSPPYSIHAGNPDSSYPSGCTCELISPQFLLPQNPRLKFSCYSDLPLYGTDGLYCIIRHSDQEETLDFIGAGGALKTGILSHQSHAEPTEPWFTYTYDLNTAPGETAQLKFVFISGPEIRSSAGIYLDDISVTPAHSPSVEVPETTRLLALFPNPFRTRTTIFLTIHRPAQVNLAVFSPDGRKIRTLIATELPAGWHSFGWDAKDEHQLPVPPGVYFLRLKCDLGPEHSTLPPARVQLKIIRL